MGKRADQLKPASFRGVPFKVSESDIEIGRRTEVHEYPKRDKPWVEDLGRATRSFEVNGFVLGDDYVDQANRLIGALETEGSGTLVHPWLGTMTVTVKDPARLHFDEGLGQATISMSFVESGELTFPSAGSATQAQSRLAADGLQTSAISDFAKNFSVSGFQDFVSSEAKGLISSVVGTLSGGTLSGLDAVGYASRAASALQTIMSLVSGSSSNLGWSIASFLGITPYVNVVTQWSSLINSLVGASGSHSFSNPSAPVIYTPSRQQAYINEVAVNSLARQSLLVQAVGASSLMDVTTYDDAVAVRDNLISALDNEAMTASSATYVALQAAKAAVWQDITVRASDSARLTTITPAETSPALVLAYEYYGDAARADEVSERNRIVRPGFVPPEPLKVLTR